MFIPRLLRSGTSAVEQFARMYVFDPARGLLNGCFPVLPIKETSAGSTAVHYCKTVS